MGKIKDFLNKNFYQIFSDSHLLYTIIFFASALVISMLSLVPRADIGNFVLFLSTSISLTYIILMFIGLIPALKDFLFSEEKRFDRNKIIGFFGVYLISFLITILYFLFGSSSNLTIEFFGWDTLLPILFIIIFFGWNLLQIIFLRSGMEAVSEKIEQRILSEHASLDTKDTFSMIFVIIAIIVAILLQFALIFYYLPQFSSIGGDLFIWFFVINIVIFIIITISSWRLITLYLRSKRNDTPNIFSSFFYMFIWLYIAYRTFSFFSALQGEADLGTDIFTTLMDIFLMVLTAVMVLRSLGGKVLGTTIFNKNNMPFFLYAFTMLYIQGQIIMITGAGNLIGVFSNRNQINLVNNFLIILITIGFYMWYSSFTLQRKGLIERNLFTREEIIKILLNYREHLDKLGYLNKEQLGEAELKTFLDKEKISSEEVFEKKEALELEESKLSEISEKRIEAESKVDSEKQKRELE